METNPRMLWWRKQRVQEKNIAGSLRMASVVRAEGASSSIQPSCVQPSGRQENARRVVNALTGIQFKSATNFWVKCVSQETVVSTNTPSIQPKGTMPQWRPKILRRTNLLLLNTRSQLHTTIPLQIQWLQEALRAGHISITKSSNSTTTNNSQRRETSTATPVRAWARGGNKT